jgi:hypothetical protein
MRLFVHMRLRLNVHPCLSLHIINVDDLKQFVRASLTEVQRATPSPRRWNRVL